MDGSDAGETRADDVARTTECRSPKERPEFNAVERSVADQVALLGEQHVDRSFRSHSPRVFFETSTSWYSSSPLCCWLCRSGR